MSERQGVAWGIEGALDVLIVGVIAFYLWVKARGTDE